MKLRTLTVKYLGWCPGVESAARFIPDRETTPARVTLMLALVATAAFSGYWVTQNVLVWIGFPRAPEAEVYSYGPMLVSDGSQLRLAFSVSTQVRQPGSAPSFDRSSLYTAMVSLDGSLSEVRKVLKDTEGPDAFLVTANGRWIIADSHSVMVSRDGEAWGDPVKVIEDKYTRIDGVGLLEKPGGEVVLIFTVDDHGYYATCGSEGGWSRTEEIPLCAHDISGFIDGDGRLAVVGVDMDSETPDAVVVQGLYLTTLEAGGWSEPRRLTRLGAPLSAFSPKVFYSGVRGGYFMVVRDPDPSSIVQENWVYYTRDFESWGNPAVLKTLDLTEGVALWASCLSLVELDDGSLVVAYYGISSDITGFPESMELISRGNYVSMSGDGVEWSAPVAVDEVVDAEALSEAASHLRVVPSVFASLVVALATVYLVARSGLIYV